MNTKRFLKEAIQIATELTANKKVLKFDVVGSATFCEEANDLDIIVLADAPGFLCAPDEVDGGDYVSRCARWMFGCGWDVPATRYDGENDQWGTLRKGNVNLIVTISPKFYDGMKLASEVCTALKLKDKGDRVVVHRIVRDGFSAEAANAARGEA
jgi:hypothetical protein